MIADEDRRLVERMYPEGSALALNIETLGKIMVATRADALRQMADAWEADLPMFRSRIQKNMIEGFVRDLRRVANEKTKVMTMLVGPEWLREKTAADPDLDTDAYSDFHYAIP